MSQKIGRKKPMMNITQCPFRNVRIPSVIIRTTYKTPKPIPHHMSFLLRENVLGYAPTITEESDDASGRLTGYRRVHGRVAVLPGSSGDEGYWCFTLMLVEGHP
jgi:hypothetical protein